MRNRSSRRSNYAQKPLLAGLRTSALAVAVGLLLGLGSAPSVRAQSKPKKFEVASIHKCGPNTIVPLREGGGLGITGQSPNRVSRSCYTVMQLIKDAYVIFADGEHRAPASFQMPQIEKAPAWLSSDLYSIEATAEGAPGQPAMLGPMMQSLLEERFKLKLHREARTGPALELTVAKGGPKVKPYDGNCTVDVPAAAAPRDPTTGRPAAGFASGRVTPPSQPGVPCRLMLNLNNGPNQLFIAKATTIDAFSTHLARVTGRTVINSTNLDHEVDIRLEYLRDQAAPGSTPADRSENPLDIQAGPSLSTAMEQQLGLKLTSVKGTRQVIVIDHVQKPSGN